MGSEATLLLDKIPEFLEAVVLVNTLTNTFTQELVNTSLSVQQIRKPNPSMITRKNEDSARPLIYKVWLNIMCCYVLERLSVICLFSNYMSFYEETFLKKFFAFFPSLDSLFLLPLSN